MQNESIYGNYYASTSSSIVQGPSNSAVKGFSSPRIRSQRSVEVRSHSPFHLEQSQSIQHNQLYPNRRSEHLISQFNRELQPVYLPPERSNYRAPLLKANGRSLSARDSQEDFEIEKMNGRTRVEEINKQFSANNSHFIILSFYRLDFCVRKKTIAGGAHVPLSIVI